MVAVGGDGGRVAVTLLAERTARVCRDSGVRVAGGGAAAVGPGPRLPGSRH